MIGFFLKDIFIGIGIDTWSHSLFIHPNNFTLFEAEFSIPLFYL
jgi:NADH-ubiquinone oxidoreductase chain 5